MLDGNRCIATDALLNAMHIVGLAMHCRHTADVMTSP
jgi:hypothetical protein